MIPVEVGRCLKAVNAPSLSGVLRPRLETHAALPPCALLFLPPEAVYPSSMVHPCSFVSTALLFQGGGTAI